MSGIIVVGLGPGTPELLTAEAHAVLNEAREIWVRARSHPVLDALPPHLTLHTFDDASKAKADTDPGARYREIAEHVVRLGQRPEGVLYGVPGSPWLGEVTVRHIVEGARARGVPVRLVQGVSFVEPVLAALELTTPAALQVADATAVAARYFPPLEADRPAIVAQLDSHALAVRVQAILLELYPDDHPVVLVEAAGTPHQRVIPLALGALGRHAEWRWLTALYIPPRQEPASLSAFMDIIFHLRSPEGCPWDREQTHLSLRPFLLEEAYEVLHALDHEGMDALREELGDLWLQIALHAQMATEEGHFTVADVLATVGQKMIRRHPHVFGDVQVESAQDVLRNWEQLKREEKGEREKGQDPFAGIPPALPALAFAQKVTKRAAKLGWSLPPLDELWNAWRRDPSASTLGALLLGLAEAARQVDIDAESALREAASRLTERKKNG